MTIDSEGDSLAEFRVNISTGPSSQQTLRAGTYQQQSAEKVTFIGQQKTLPRGMTTSRERQNAV